MIYKLAKYLPLTDGPLPSAQGDKEAMYAAKIQLELLDAKPGYYALIEQDSGAVVCQIRVDAVTTINVVE